MVFPSRRRSAPSLPLRPPLAVMFSEHPRCEALGHNRSKNGRRELTQGEIAGDPVDEREWADQEPGHYKGSRKKEFPKNSNFSLAGLLRAASLTANPARDAPAMPGRFDAACKPCSRLQKTPALVRMRGYWSPTAFPPSIGGFRLITRRGRSAALFPGASLRPCRACATGCRDRRR